MKITSLTSSHFYKLFVYGLVILFCSCTSEDGGKKDELESDASTGEVSTALHLSFKTPDWEQHIDCEKLDLFPYAINDSTYTVSASSASTRESFVFSYPKTSAKMLKAKISLKHKITEYGSNEEPFQFSQKLPLNANSIEDTSKRLVSAKGLSDSEYNQVVKVELLGSEQNYDLFKVVCKYQMKAYLINDPATIKTISGTFAFKVRTSKN